MTNGITKTSAAAGALLLGTALATAPALADHHEGGMVEIGPMFTADACAYRPGKGRDDLMKAVDNWKSQMGKIDSPALNAYFAALFEPMFASSPVDVWWIGVSPTLKTLMAGGAAYTGSREGRAANARFDEVVDCRTSAWMSTQVHDGGGPAPGEGDTRVAETFACSLREGHRLSDLDGADAYYSDALTEMDAQTSAWRLTPAWGASAGIDVVYLVGHQSGDSLADVTTRMANSPHGAMISGWYDELVECSASLHATTILRMPAGGG